MVLHVQLVRLGMVLTHLVLLTLQHNAFQTQPEIRVSKWISDSERDYIDEDYDAGNFEWNDKIDTAAIQISGFGSHEYLVSQHVAAIYIECRAQYPVEWVFHNSKYVSDSLRGIKMKTFRRASSVTESSSNVFIASLEISTQSNRATGNYTCRSSSTNKSTYASNTIFIFWEGSSPPYLVLSGNVLEIELKPTNNNVGSVILPCYTAHPSVPVHLYKDVGGEFKNVPSNFPSMSFDPKTGFMLTYNNISDVIGRYRCVSGEDSDDDGGILEVYVKKPAKANSRCEGESCFQRRLSLGTRFAYNEKTEEIVCCGKAGTGKQTRLHTLFCSNPSVCRMYEAGMYLTSGSNGKRSENGSCVTERIYPRDFGLVRCKGNGIDVFTYVYTELWTPEQEYMRAVFDWKDLHPENMVHVMVHSPAPYYDKQRVTVNCQTLHSYFSDGIKWGLKWKNGSLTYFDSIMNTDTDPRLHGSRSTYLRLNLDLAELICFAPVWNSTEWVTKSFRLDVKPSRSPVISGDSTEELTLSLNDTEKILECVSNGDPPAKVKWTRNNEDVPRNMVIWNQNGTSVLLFKTVTYQTHAVYKCIAKNEVGQAVKIYRVFVEDTRHAAWSTAFAVVIPILVIVFVMVLAFLVWKVQLQKNVVNHLTRVVFRETNNS